MNHAAKVKAVAAKIKAQTGLKTPLIFIKKSVAHVVPDPYRKDSGKTKIYLGDLTEILEIDSEAKTCVAESGVTFYELVNRLLPLGFMPYTVPELKTITIGGAISGGSVESMSYRYGGFHHSCLEYEYIDAFGRVRTCSPENDADIFEMLHGSYGTLGIITKLKFKLHPAKPYVKLNYQKFNDFDVFWNFLQDRCRLGDYLFIDTIIHSQKNFVVCLGELRDEAPYTSRYDGVNIYYKSTLDKSEDYLRLQDYFFRYDTECHWLTKTIPPLEYKAVRFLFGRWFLGSTNLIKWSERLAGILKMKKRPEVVVDVFLPAQKFPEFYRWYEHDFNFYPLWIVPYRTPLAYPWINPEHAAKNDATFYIDCAIYGKANNEQDIDYSEVLEKKVFALGGIKTLISRNHYTEADFWRTYNKPAYEAIKAKTDPDNLFGTTYEKRVKKI